MSTQGSLELAQKLFPYKFKNFQQEMLSQLVAHPYVLWHAPTGFGKTALALVSSLTHLLGEDHSISKIIVLVRMKTQIFRILDECVTISAHYSTLVDGLLSTSNSLESYASTFPKELIALPLIGKEELCIYPKGRPQGHIDCAGLKCPFFKAPVPQGPELHTLVRKYFFRNLKSTDEIKHYLVKEIPSCCPYYVLRSMAKQAHIIVPTHTWLLNSRLYETLRADLGVAPEHTALIVDEVHNFRSHVSGQLSYVQMIQGMNFASKYHLSCAIFLSELVEHCKKTPLTMIKPFLTDTTWQLDLLKDSITSMQREGVWSSEDKQGLKALEAISDFFEVDGDLWYYDTELDLKTNKLVKFLRRTITFPELTFGKIHPYKRIILMSGTLFPPKAYMTLYGLSNKYTLVEVPREAQKVFYATYVQAGMNSRMKNRNIGVLKSQLDLVIQLHALNPNHTLVFSTSHNYTNNLVKLAQYYYPNQEFYVEGTSSQNQVLIDKLRLLQHELLFVTMSGSFSEGIEVKEENTGASKITLIIFTGIPHPPPTLTHRLLEYKYMQRFGQRRALLFLKWLPIYQTLLQAAGRGIRRPTDACATICLDYRLPALQIFPQKLMLTTSDFQTIMDQLTVFYNHHML